jgi:Lrp/AsnC family transcriptional regulator
MCPVTGQTGLKMSIALHNYDKKILALLQTDCSLSVADIARQVGLSTSPCWRRIAQLEEAGIIRKRVAVLDHARLGMEVVAFVTVRLSQHGRENLEQFETEIRRFPEVLECYTVTGDTDYLLKIITRDIRHFEAFLRNHIMLMPMIRETHSTIAVTEIKDTTELPLETQL